MKPAPQHGLCVRLHVRAQNGVDARLITALPAEPCQQVGIKPHGHDWLAGWQYDLGILPECFIRKTRFRIGLDAFSYRTVGHSARLSQSIPVRLLAQPSQLEG